MTTKPRHRRRGTPVVAPVLKATDPSRSHALKAWTWSAAALSVLVAAAIMMVGLPGNNNKSESLLLPQTWWGRLTSVANPWLCIRPTTQLNKALMATETPSPDDVVSQFLAWFEHEGGERHKIGVATFQGMGRGIVAEEAVQDRDVVLFVPKDIIICRDTIFKHTPKSLHKKLTKLDQTELITAFLLLETSRGRESRWFPYLQVLPSLPETGSSNHGVADVTASPLFLDDRMIAMTELQDEKLIQAANQERAQATLSYRRFRRLFRDTFAAKIRARDDPPGLPVLLTYLWARFLVSSRAFSILGDRFLVPFGDIFNGARQPNHTRKRGNGQHFLQYHELHETGMTIRADRDTSRGEQVMEDYGDNDNYIYFLYHGFLMPGNDFDCASLRLPPLETGGDSEHLEIMQKRVVLAFYRIEESPRVCISGQGTLSGYDARVATVYARLSMKQGSQLEECLQREMYPTCFERGHDQTESVILAQKNDERALLLRAINAQLAAYPTTFEEDSAQLQRLVAGNGNDGSKSLQHVVKFRLSRKQLLQDAAKILSHRHLPPSFESAQDGRERGISTPEIPAEDDQKELQTVSEADADVNARTSAAVVERFMSWLENGPVALPVNHVSLQYISAEMGYGVVATTNLEPGDVYLSVPVERILDANFAIQSSVFLRNLVEQHPSLSEHDVLVLFVLHEVFVTKHQSLWKPYLDMLPDMDHHGSLLFYDDHGEALQLLERATDLFPAVREYQARVTEASTRLHRVLNQATRTQSTDWFTANRYRWGSAILDSRSIWWSGRRHLVPLLDMVNCVERRDPRQPQRRHDPHYTTLRSDGRAAVTRASWSFQRGEQVVENYAQPNYIYLLYHGFVLTENSFDCAHIRFHLTDAVVDRGEDRGNHHGGQRGRVIRMMERMKIFSWTPDLCVPVRTHGDGGGGKEEDHHAGGGDDQQTGTLAHRGNLQWDMLLRIALIHKDARRAVELENEEGSRNYPRDWIRLDHVDAALDAVATRLDRLTVGDHVDFSQTNQPNQVKVIQTYVSQQRQLMEALHQQLLLAKARLLNSN